MTWYVPEGEFERATSRFAGPVKAVVTIAGSTGVGKTTTSKLLAVDLTAFGFPAVVLSHGPIYRLLAMLALDRATQGKPAEAFTAPELVALAQADGIFIAPNGKLASSRYGAVLGVWLEQPEVTNLVPRWGNEPDANDFAVQLIRSFERSHDGIVVIEGRTVNIDYADLAGMGRFFLKCLPVVAGRRSGRDVESIIRRDEQDRATGALPARPTGWHLDISDPYYDNQDHVVTEIFRWMMWNIPGIRQNLLGVQPVGPQR
jgi:cytidylate kinase